MKKSLFILATAALVLASCNNDVTIAENQTLGNQPQEIGLSPMAKKPLRAASANNVYNAVGGDGTVATDYPKNYTMDVVAYVVPKNNDGTDNTTTRGDYFSKTNFVYNNAGGAPASSTYWGGATAKYWPLSPATLNFLAVSQGGPATGVTITTTFGSADANLASALSTVMAGTNGNQPATVDAKDAQHDLMYAFGRGTVSQVGNSLSFNNAQGYVDMTFHHAQAWVMFRVKATTDGVETNIHVNSINLNNAYYGGTFVAGVDNYNIGTTDLAWTASSEKWTAKTNQGASITVPNYAGANLTTSFAEVGSGLMIVPTGSMDAASTSFESFTINYTYNGRTFDYTFAPTDAEKTLLMGKKYIFDITFKLHEIFVQPTVQNWDATTTNYVDVPTQSFANASAGAYNMSIGAGAGVYTFQVSGLGTTVANDVVVANVTDGSWDNKATLGTAPSKSYNTTSKVATVSFKVDANETGTDKVYKITVTDGNGSTNSSTGYVNTITITQGHS